MSRRLFEQTIMHLLCSNGSSEYSGKRFYGAFINKMRKVFTDKVPTLGVSITDQVNLYVNPEFFGSLTEKQRVEVLEHECLHLVNGHLTRIPDQVNKHDMAVWNVAGDAVINENLSSLHAIEGVITIDNLNKQFKGINLKRGEAMEYYYAKIKKYMKDNPDQFDKVYEMGSGEGGIDTHETWAESGQGENGDTESDKDSIGNNSQLANEMIKKTMKQAIEDCDGAGNVPMDILKALEELNKSTVNWKQQLKRFFGRAHKFSKISTRNKLNRRYRHLQPGKRKKPNVHIAIGVDESGSICDNAFKQFFSEIDVAARLDGIKFTIIHIDTSVNKVYEYQAGMKIDRTGCGGTCYMPAITEANKLKVDGMIFFGDGDNWGDEKLIKPKYPFLWAMEEGCNPPTTDFGSVVEVKIEGNKRW